MRHFASHVVTENLDIHFIACVNLPCGVIDGPMGRTDTAVVNGSLGVDVDPVCEHSCMTSSRVDFFRASPMDPRAHGFLDVWGGIRLNS